MHGIENTAVLISMIESETSRDLKKILEDAGVEVYAADEGRQIFKIAQVQQPDAIILEKIFGETSGFEVCKALRKDPKTSSIPVLIMTTVQDVEDKVRALSAGAVDVLTSPLQPDDVLARTATQISLYAKQEHEHDEVFSDFLQSGSHDLRTPLTAAKTYIHLLKKGAKGGSVDSYLNKLDRYVDEVSNTLNQLYTLTNLDTVEQLRLMPHTLNHIVEYAGYSAGPLCHNKEIVMRLNLLPQPLTIMADEGMLHQALFQVLSNAVMYTPADGHVTITTKLGQGRDVIIEITDDGIGIEKRHLPFIFQRFYRVAEGPAALVNGAGLGLAISRRIIDLHHGTITAESAPFEFTTIRVTLPLQ